MLVGAFARDVWFWHLHGIETERATEDMGRLAQPITYDHIAGKLRLETGSSTSCPLAQQLRSRVARGDFHRARVLLRGVLYGMESRKNR
jgi:predicted nucleotidyltransferase